MDAVASLSDAAEVDMDSDMEGRSADEEEIHAQMGIQIEANALVEHVDICLDRGESFSRIASSLGLSRKALSRRLLQKGWGGVYSQVSAEECREAILLVVPFDRAGINWGIRHVQALLRATLKMRVPRKLVQDVLYDMQPDHMQRREVRQLFCGQYDIIEAMALWHMDCECIV